MFKYLALFVCLIFVNNAVAQDIFKMVQDKDSIRDTKTYFVRSIDGKKSVIHILPNYSRNILKISCLKDTISLYDFWGETPEISVLNKTFLEIKYEVRGGSNLALGNTLLLCVSENKLYEALHVLRYADWESDLVKKYNVDFSLIDYKGQFILSGIVKEKVISQNEPETNYHFYNKTILHFDNKLKVFYSIKDNLFDTLKVSYPNLTYKREIQGTFPKVLLGREEYIFIGGQWFEIYNSTLTKY